jgi:hypothetical protein
MIKTLYAGMGGCIFFSCGLKEYHAISVKFRGRRVLMIFKNVDQISGENQDIFKVILIYFCGDLVILSCYVCHS